MTRVLPFLFVALGALLPAQTPQSLGVFPEALYALQPALDQVLHLSDEQATKIANRCAPLREELKKLEEEVAAAEPAERGKLLGKLDATRAEVEPALRRIVESALGTSQRTLITLTHELHADAVRGAAEELGKRAKKGQTPRLESLVQEQILKLCPGLDSPEVESIESALQAALAKRARSGEESEQPAAGEPVPKKRGTGSALLESLATGALKGVVEGGKTKPKDLLRDLAEGAAKAALEQATGALIGELQKSKPKKQ